MSLCHGWFCFSAMVELIVYGCVLTHIGYCCHLQEMELQWSELRCLVPLVVCIFVLLKGTAMAQSPKVSAIFIFGDSLSDPGNNNYINPTLSRANTPPNGMDFPGGPIATGRYTNGRTTVDIIGNKLTLNNSFTLI